MTLERTNVIVASTVGALARAPSCVTTVTSVFLSRTSCRSTSTLTLTSRPVCAESASLLSLPQTTWLNTSKRLTVTRQPAVAAAALHLQDIRAQKEANSLAALENENQTLCLMGCSPANSGGHHPNISTALEEWLCQCLHPGPLFHPRGQLPQPLPWLSNHQEGHLGKSQSLNTLWSTLQEIFRLRSFQQILR